MNPIAIVLENFPHCEEFSEQSFLNILHDEHRIDMDAYWKLEWAVIQLTSADEEYSRDQYWPVFRIFSHLSFLFCAHAGNGRYRIINFDNCFIYDLINRTSLVFEGYFKGRTPNLHTDFGYPNPLLEGKNPSASERQFKNLPSPEVSPANDDQSELEFPQGGLDSETHAHCLEIIYKNLSFTTQWSSQSFLARLQNEHRLDMAAYWQLEWAITWLTKAGDKASSLHGWPVHQIFTWVTGMLYAHIDPEDSFEIMEISKESFHAFRKRINVVFDGFFKVEPPDMSVFKETNPLLG